eukprot:4292879-Prymnesium_polylepis.2
MRPRRRPCSLLRTPHTALAPRWRTRRAAAPRAPPCCLRAPPLTARLGWAATRSHRARHRRGDPGRAARPGREACRGCAAAPSLPPACRAAACSPCSRRRPHGRLARGAR